MAQMTMKQLNKALATASKNLIPNTFRSKDYLTVYFSRPELCDFASLSVRFKDLLVDEDLEDLTDVEKMVTYTLLTNDWKYDRMFTVLTEEYDPLWNYDGVNVFIHGEKIIDFLKDGYSDSTLFGVKKNTTSHDYSTITSDKSTMTRGNDQTTFSKGAETLDTKYERNTDGTKVGDTVSHERDSSGALIGDTVTRGQDTTSQGNDVNSHDVFGFNSSDPQGQSKDTMSHGTVTNSFGDVNTKTSDITTTYSDVQNKTVYGEDKTKNEYGTVENSSQTAPVISQDDSSTDTLTHGEHTDRDTYHTYTDREEKHGNQGTTTSQQMLIEEMKVAVFNLTEYIITDVIMGISSRLYKEV